MATLAHTIKWEPVRLKATDAVFFFFLCQIPFQVRFVWFYCWYLCICKTRCSLMYHLLHFFVKIFASPSWPRGENGEGVPDVLGLNPAWEDCLCSRLREIDCDGEEWKIDWEKMTCEAPWLLRGRHLKSGTEMTVAASRAETKTKTARNQMSSSGGGMWEALLSFAIYSQVKSADSQWNCSLNHLLPPNAAFNWVEQAGDWKATQLITTEEDWLR